MSENHANKIMVVEDEVVIAMRLQQRLTSTKACARFLLQKGVVSFIASDAHSAGYRRPVLSEGVKAAGKIIGREEALKLVTINPKAMLAGEKIRR